MTAPAPRSAAIDWERPILIGCSPSSGSTLLSVMLDAHPDILCGPEFSMFSHPFFWSQAGPVWRERVARYLELSYHAKALPEWTLDNGVCPYAELVFDDSLPWYGVTRSSLIALAEKSDDGQALVEHVFGPLLQSKQKTIWADKSPTNLYAFKAFLERHPRGKAIYLFRDGRDTICSLMRRSYSFKKAASVWLTETALAETYSTHPRVFPVRYEALVQRRRRRVAA